MNWLLSGAQRNTLLSLHTCPVWHLTNSSELLAVIDICQLWFSSRKTEMAAIMPNLVSRDVKTSWTHTHIKKRPEKVYRCAEGSQL